MANAKFWTKKRIIILVVALLVVAAIVVTAVVLGVKSSEPETALETVTRGSLQRSISSSGQITETGIAVDVPLYAAVNKVYDADAIAGYRDDFSWTDFIINSIYNSEAGNDLPALYYEVTYVNEHFVNKNNILNTDMTGEESERIFSVAPVVLDVDAVKDAYDKLVGSGVLDGENVEETLVAFAVSILAEPGGSTEELPESLNEFFYVDEGNPVDVTTEYISDVVTKYLGSENAAGINYTLSNFRLQKGNKIGVQTKVFKIDFTQVYTAFTINEYDVAKVDEQLRNEERVYAALSVNALNGRKVLAEITEITKGSYSAGVAYYGVVARVIFGEETETEDGTKRLDFTYYDSELNEKRIAELGIDDSDIVRREEVLIGYSVSVRVQQEGIADTLIVPTKCIFYNDQNEPYVLVREGNRERRVAITVTLSTGSDAAVTPEEEGALKEGDNIVYRADDSLLSSILG